jgi:hypothetical protein
MIMYRRMRWARHVGRMARRGTQEDFWRESHKESNDNEDLEASDLREIGWGCMDWINLTQDRDQWRVLAKVIMSLRVP